MSHLLNTLHVALALTLIAGASGQDKNPPSNIAKGEIVSELDKAIMHVFQARNNDYWFVSKERGVYRYDGKTLVNFTKNDGLGYNGFELGGIQEDQSGNLYFPTVEWDAIGRRHKHGISKFDGKSFSTLTAPDSTSSWKMQPDDLWFNGGQDSGAVLRYDGKTLHRLELPKTKEGDDHLAQWPRSKYPNIKHSPYDNYRIFKDSKGNLWFCTASLGVCRYDGKSFTWIPDRELWNGSFGTRSIIEDKEGKFWFCKTLHRYTIDLSDPATPSFRREDGIRDPKDPNKSLIEGIMSCIVDGTGAIWMATYGMGVWRLDGNRATHYPVKDGDQAITLFSISHDKQGVLWLGTHTAGAYKFNGKTFEKFRP